MNLGKPYRLHTKVPKPGEEISNNHEVTGIGKPQPRGEAPIRGSLEADAHLVLLTVQAVTDVVWCGLGYSVA